MKVLLKESQILTLLESFPFEIKEDIYLKKDTANQKLYIFSDKEDPKEKTKETIGLKDKFKALGFKWDGRAWTGDYSKFDEINKLIKSHNKTRAIIEKLEDLENMVESDSDLPKDKKEELVSKIELYVKDLANATDIAAMDAAIRSYLTFYSKFHGYSLYNTLLIFLQKRDATKVASYKSWKNKFNRGVKKGAKSITIWVPLLKKDVASDTIAATQPAPTDSESKRLVGFRLGSVYDISDTYSLGEGGDIPKEPQWWADNTPSKTADILVLKLKEVSEDLGIKLTKDTAKGGEKGYSAGGHINLSSDIVGVAEASTLVHELAHELLHWKKKSPFYNEDPEFNTRDMKELQAESVSYVVMKHYDLPVTQHPTYLVLWKANKEKIMRNLDIIQKCAKYIIEKVDGVQVDETEFTDDEETNN